MQTEEQGADQFFTNFVTWIMKQVWLRETAWHVAEGTKASCSPGAAQPQHWGALLLVAGIYDHNEHGG